MALTTHSHLAPRLKKKHSYASTPLLDPHDLFWGEFYFTFKKRIRTFVKQYKQCTYKRNTKARSRNNCYCGKATNIQYSKCVSVALVIQLAKRMRLIIL